MKDLLEGRNQTQYIQATHSRSWEIIERNGKSCLNPRPVNQRENDPKQKNKASIRTYCYLEKKKEDLRNVKKDLEIVQSSEKAVSY